MGITSPQLLTGSVAHARIFPRKNHFRYRIYYLVLPLSKLHALPLAHNRPGLMSLYDRDHAKGKEGDLEDWAREILKSYNIKADGEITLICMPRIVGYVFNPVSFWLCHDQSGQLKSVICEVHNTFGEKHAYLCAHQDGRTISEGDTLQAKKLFHVSPFLQTEGFYEFRFASNEKGFAAHIDYFDGHGQKQLVTNLSGLYEAMTARACRRVFWEYPLITLKATFLIHYQAAKLVFKKIRYISKPVQSAQKLSATENLTKM